jgi:hypothetical protein
MPAKNGTSNGAAAPNPAPAPGANAPVSQLPPAPLGASPYQLRREYVSGGSPGWFYGGKYATALPAPLDDVESDFGDDIYDKMMLDTQISACVTILKAGILEGGVELTSAISDADDEKFDLAKRITDEAVAMIDNLRTPIDDVLWDMLACIQKGSKVAELVFELQPGKLENRPMLHIVSIKPKPRRSTAFVVDAYDNVFGMLVRLPGQSSPFLGLNAFDPQNPPMNFLPREKFAIATFRTTDGDPRGTSLLRPAYDPWWRKRQIYQEHLRYLAQFAGPSIIGFTPPDAQTLPVTDDLGNLVPGAVPITPEEAMLVALQQLRNGTAAAFPGGSLVQPIEMHGEGIAFLKAIAECNVSITKSLLTQELATEEGEHQARAAAQVHQDVLGTLVRQGKRGLLRMFVKDILKPWVIYNWGSKAVDLVPVPSLGETEQQDMAPLIAALASAGYLVGASQLPELDVMLGLPKRDAEADEQLALAHHQAAAAEASATAAADQGAAATAPESAGAEPGSSTTSKTTPASAAPATSAPGGPADRKPVGNKPAARSSAKMAAEELPPAADELGRDPIRPPGRRLATVPASVRYTAADLRALAKAWDESMPDYEGLLEATIKDARV